MIVSSSGCARPASTLPPTVCHGMNLSGSRCRLANSRWCAGKGVQPASRPLSSTSESRHTPIMTLKTAALLAFISMVLVSALALADFIRIVSGILREIVPMTAFLRSLIYLFTSITITVFFYVFHRAQS